MLAILVLLLVVTLGGYFIFARFSSVTRARIEAELTSIADRKVHAIANWMAERRGDAETIHNDPAVALDVERWLGEGARPGQVQTKILARLAAVQRAYRYRDVTLFDQAGALVLSVTGELPTDQAHKRDLHMRDLARQAVRSTEIGLSDLHPAAEETAAAVVHMEILVPLRVFHDSDVRVSGVVVLSIDPQAYFFSLLQDWPVPSSSAETVLVRRDGDDVVFLTPPRHNTGAAFSRHRPLAAAALPAAAAVRGQTGFFEGTDDRNLPVLTVLRRIPDSAWFLAVKIDKDEAFAPVRQFALTLVLLTGAFIASMAGFIAYWWRQQHRHALHRAAELQCVALVRHFDYLAKYANDIILLTDESGVIIEANDRAEEAYGYLRAELIGMNIRTLWTSEALPDFGMQWQRASGPDGCLFETKHRRQDRSIFAAEVSARRIAIEGRDYRQAIIRDITERKQAEDALKSSEARYSGLLRVSPVGVFETDAQGNCLFVNHMWCDITGLTLERAAGQGWSQALHPDDRDRVVEEWRQATSKGATFASEYRFRNRNGVTRWVFGQGAPMTDGAGLIGGYVGTIIDITERKRAETAQQEAKEEAERANAAKTRFLGAASHDLRQPIQAAVLFTNLLNDRARDPKQQELIEKIQQSLDHMSEMLNVLLDISRLDAGIVEPELRDFAIQSVMQCLAGEFEPLTRERGLAFRWVPSYAAVHSDRQLLERILRNLLSNALKYTERGRILLGCRRTGDHLRVQVWDTGIGIAEGQLQSIFEEFYQIGNSARNYRQGFGLGLAIVRRLATLLGHRIAVRSIVGKGSMFEVTVPLGHSAAALAAPDRESTASNGKGLVVVIDDDPLVLESLQLCLEGFGYDVAIGETDDEVLAILGERGHKPDLILADYRLANGKTGRDAIQCLQSTFDGAIPGILLTGDTSPDRLKEAQSSGYRLLHKPITARGLQETVEQMLRAPEPQDGQDGTGGVQMRPSASTHGRTAG